MKYYFCLVMNEGERCYRKRYIKEWMIESEILEAEIIEAEMEVGTSYFYCQEFGEVGETGEGCGIMCEKYQPRNGKSGRCRHSTNCYIQTDKKQMLRINP